MHALILALLISAPGDVPLWAQPQEAMNYLNTLTTDRCSETWRFADQAYDMQQFTHREIMNLLGEDIRSDTIDNSEAIQKYVVTNELASMMYGLWSASAHYCEATHEQTTRF